MSNMTQSSVVANGVMRFRAALPVSYSKHLLFRHHRYGAELFFSDSYKPLSLSSNSCSFPRLKLASLCAQSIVRTLSPPIQTESAPSQSSHSSVKDTPESSSRPPHSPDVTPGAIRARSFSQVSPTYPQSTGADWVVSETTSACYGPHPRDLTGQGRPQHAHRSLPWTTHRTDCSYRWSMARPAQS